MSAECLDLELLVETELAEETKTETIGTQTESQKVSKKTKKVSRKSKKVIAGIGVFLVVVIIIIALLSVRIEHDGKLVELGDSVKKLQDEHHENRMDAINQTGINTKGVTHYKLQKPTVQHIKVLADTDAEFVIHGFVEDGIFGDPTIKLIDKKYFEVLHAGVYSITAKVAFVGLYRNAVIGIYIDDTLCDKALTSASLATDKEEQYMNVLTLQAECLDVEVQQGQLITVRSFHNRTIYRSEKTSWVHIVHTDLSI